MTPFETKLTKLLDIRYPIVSAPMAGAAGGRLAAQISLAGGFGFIAAGATTSTLTATILDLPQTYEGYSTPDVFKYELSLACLELPLHPTLIHIGVGFLCWLLEKPDSQALEVLQIALDSGVQAVWFAFGADIGRWVKYVREHDSRSDRHATVIFVQCSSVPEALVAIRTWKVDVVVAQGLESGGHGSSCAVSLLPFIPGIRTEIPNPRPCILACGGLANGYQVASCIYLGADGVVLGTRFLLTPESLYTDAQKKALLAGTTTVRTRAFDKIMNVTGMPTLVNGRALRNSTVDEFERGMNIEEIRKKFYEGVRKGDPDRMLVWAGTGVALMTEIKPAKDVVYELARDAADHLSKKPEKSQQPSQPSGV